MERGEAPSDAPIVVASPAMTSLRRSMVAPRGNVFGMEQVVAMQLLVRPYGCHDTYIR
jgi:hypothetical protein